MATGGTRAKNLSSAALDEEMADAAMSPAGWTVDQNPAIERQVARISECHVAVPGFQRAPLACGQACLALSLRNEASY